MKALLENLPDEFAAMLGENQNWIIGRPSNCNKERRGPKRHTRTPKQRQGMAPGGKIVKPEDEVFYYISTTNTRIFNFCLPAGE